jgi:hypothetical protein
MAIKSQPRRTGARDSFTHLLARVPDCKRCQPVNLLGELRSALKIARAKCLPNLVQFRRVLDRQDGRPFTRVIEQFDGYLSDEIALAYKFQN